MGGSDGHPTSPMETTFTKTEKATIGISLAALLVLGVVLFGYMATHQSTVQTVGDAGASTLIPTLSVNTTFVVGPQSNTQVLATSTARIFAQLSATTTVYCATGDVVPSATNGAPIEIGLGQPFVVNGMNLYTGAIDCKAPASTTMGVIASQ